MYSKKVMEMFRNPKFAGEIKNADAIGEVGNVKCGDIMKVFLKIKDEKIKYSNYCSNCLHGISNFPDIWGGWAEESPEHYFYHGRRFGHC